MKERMKKLLACAGTVGALTIMLSVPVMADTKEDTQSIETQEVQEEAYVPRPRWQVWAARIALVLFIIGLIMYYCNIFGAVR